MYIVGTGPSELHAHIDLDQRLIRLDASATATGVTSAQQGGHWSVVAKVRNLPVGEGQ